MIGNFSTRLEEGQIRDTRFTNVSVVVVSSGYRKFFLGEAFVSSQLRFCRFQRKRELSKNFNVSANFVHHGVKNFQRKREHKSPMHLSSLALFRCTEQRALLYPK